MPPGPPPQRDVRRRNHRPGWRTLPAEGRYGDTPPWPLRPRPAKPVADRWVVLWATPQAAAWEDQGYDHVVARYALKVVAAEAPDATAALLSEVRQLEDRLGLTPMAMRRLAWDLSEETTTDAPMGSVEWLEDARRRLASRDVAPG